jgi:hypothetical protein
VAKKGINFASESTLVIMSKFIELKVSEEEETKIELINIDSVGRVYPSPQNTRRSIVELNYHSINDAPVYLEVEMPYETLRLYFVES